ncbi:PREDICTED: uncharacterized protein LOC104611329 [Nelumbo nucifera]|uniref:Uncharacterized protein n=2 Tax=Nelumbo nucifera TaxID=4432 RepID=A0A822ZC91_NELNU|nr:PREDICTED: uncharacterized protein LOC104611329 [Nelumbo nucifera]DAD42752.1 TPA_asm: hypothetical protein HUJ06_000982 [Nelumbo nucifera]
MAVEGDVWQDFASSITSNSKEPSQTGDAPSPEDVAWADSCLIKDPELSDSNWDSLKDALLDILSFQAHSYHDSSANESDGYPQENDSEMLPVIEEAESENSPRENDNDDLFPIGEEAEREQVLLGAKNDFLPDSERAEAAYRDYWLNEVLFPKENGDGGIGVNVSSSDDIDSTPNDIFRVWNLDTQVEEDELVKELKKALAENSIRSMPLNLDDVGTGPLRDTPVSLDGTRRDTTLYDLGTETNEEAIDNLIAGIADLSFHDSST